MGNGPKMFIDFIMERTQEGKQEEMKVALEEFFKPPQDGNFDPEAFKRRIDLITSMLKPEAVAEFQKMMNPFGHMEDDDEPIEIKNVLEQPNRHKWENEWDKFSKEELREAIKCSQKAHEMECDCWNTHCVFFGDCKKCIIFHLSLKQFPTCHRSYLGELEDHYIIFSRDK
ncbi:MAG: hypothetical protein GX197_01800 [Firmicutes bacterium]|nr:hypothetical protein [Bacillota bacterium]NLP37996.1 hypothetical protein [Bacillota bacterium]